MVVNAKVIPRIGLGMAALGRPGYINLDRSTQIGEDRVRDVAYMQEKANHVLDKAMEIGVTHFDCARSYGLSEKFVGDYLRSKKVSPDDVTVTTKWGYTYVADWNVTLPPGEPHEVKDHSTETFIRQVEETIEAVGEYVDLYQIHSATFESGVLTNSTVHEALENCKAKRGWAIGLSVSSPKQGDVLREAMKIKMSDGTPLFDSVQCTYNLLEQRPQDALLEAHNAGMDIIVKEGLANGRILKNELLLKNCDESIWGFAVAPDALALACILAQPFCPRVLSGAVSGEQLESNYKAIEIATLLKNEKSYLLNELMEGCLMSSEEYWKERSTLSWN